MYKLPAISVALRAAVVFGVLTCFAPTSAFAQTSNTHDEARARHHFDEGARFFYEGDFSRAVVEFRRAYQYKPDPMILYNLSLAQSRLGNIADAYDAGVAASAMPGMPDAARVRNDARVGALSVALSADRLARRIETLSPRQPPTNPDQVEAMSPIAWTGIGTALVGTGLLTYALVLNQRLGPDIEEYRSAQREGRVGDYYALREHIEAQTSRGRVVFYSGLAITATGIGLWIYDFLDRDESSNYNITVNLAPFSRTGMLQVTTRF